MKEEVTTDEENEQRGAESRMSVDVPNLLFIVCKRSCVVSVGYTKDGVSGGE